VDRDQARRAPKVELHDHLDGGLRVATVVELAAAVGHPLPADGEDALRAWFFQGGRGADLPRYLQAFDQTVAVLQRADAIRRVAREFAEDLSSDGIVHGEVRYAPELSTAGGLGYDEVIEAILAGFADGPDDVEVRLIVCALRHLGNAPEAFEAAARFVGGGLGVTLHAGEAAGPDSIADALDQGAQRLGHGVRIVEDLGEGDAPGEVAGRVLTGGVTLEVCPTSNVHTGVCPDIASHPIERLRRAGFAVTLNTDNRLMSGVTLTDEVVTCAEVFGWSLTDLEVVTGAAVESAFVTDVERDALRERVARGFAALVP
jgi:adenosine deaminase